MKYIIYASISLLAWIALSGCAQVAPVEKASLEGYGRKAALETRVWVHRPLPARTGTGRPMPMPVPMSDLYESPAGEINMFLVHQGEDLFPCGPETSVTLKYSNGDGETGFCPPVPILPSDALKWTGTAVLNGFKVEKNVTRCTANPNVPSKSIATVLDDITYDNSSNTVHVNAQSKYDINGRYDVDMWYSSVRANRKYMQFWSNAVSLSMQNDRSSSGVMIGNDKGVYPVPVYPSCNNDNECVINLTVDVNSLDQNDSKIHNSFYRDKKVFALLQGLSLNHDRSSRKFIDSEVSLGVRDGDIIAENGTVSLQIIVNYNGQNTPKAFNTTVYFVIGVYDSEHVAYVDVGSTRGADWSDLADDRTVIDQVTANLPWGRSPKGDFTCDESGCNKSTVLPMFVGLKSWGFDLDNSYRVRSIRGVARLNALENVASGNARVSVMYAGEAICKKCTAPARSIVPNAMAAGVVLCEVSMFAMRLSKLCTLTTLMMNCH